jgi:aryl-alcohol dehydrogenase (NADP+)
VPWSPLARGFLAANRRTPDDGDTERSRTDVFAHKLYYAPEDFTVAESVVEVAGARGVSPAQVALAWVLQQPVVTAPIVGATRMQQLEEAVTAVNILLTDDERARLEEPYVPHRVLM